MQYRLLPLLPLLILGGPARAADLWVQDELTDRTTVVVQEERISPRLAAARPTFLPTEAAKLWYVIRCATGYQEAKAAVAKFFGPPPWRFDGPDPRTGTRSAFVVQGIRPDTRGGLVSLPMLVADVDIIAPADVAGRTTFPIWFARPR